MQLEYYNVIKQLQQNNGTTPYWIEIIRDMVDGLGYSYSRIARRIGVSPSTIQKLATKDGRQPRQAVFFALVSLYYKLFYSEFRLPRAEQYLALKKKRQMMI